MRKLALLVVVLIAAAVSLASMPIKMASEKVAVYVNPPLNASGVPVETSDSMWVMTWSDNGTATRYEARSTTAPFSDIGFDTTLALFAGSTNLRYVYNQTISTIDGTAGNFVLAGTITAFTAGIPTHTNFAVQVVADSLSKIVSLAVAYLNATISSRSTYNPAADSVLVDESTLWGVGVTVNDKTGFSLANLNADTLRDVIGDSTTAWKDSILNAIEDANKANFKATGFATSAQGDSLTNAITDANKANFKATGFSTFNPASDSVTLDRTNTLLYTGNFNTAYSTFNVATDSVTIDRTNTLLYLGNFNTAYSTLTASDNIGINWGDITNPTTVVGLSGTTILKSSNVDNIASTDTITTVLGNVNGSVASVTGAVGSVTGSVGSVASGGITTGSFAAGAIDDAAIADGAIDWAGELDTTGSGAHLDSAKVSRIIGRKVWGVAAGTGADSIAKASRIIGGSSAGDTINAHAPHGNNWASVGVGGDTSGIANNVWNHGTRTLTSGAATADIYPLLERKTTVDAVGATANLLFVIDTTALGTSSETTLLEKAVTIRDADDGKWIKATTIARANCVADNCTLQVAAALPWDVEAGDTVWFWGDRVVPDYPTSAALAAEIRDTVLNTDTTGYRGDASIGDLIVTGGESVLDTASIGAVLDDRDVTEGIDSILAMANTSLGKGAPRRGEIADTASVSRSVWDNDVVAKASRTVGVVDSTGKLGEEVLSSLPDSVTQAVMEIQDSVQTQAWASAGVATLPDSVTSAVMEIQDSVQSQSWAATGSGLGTGANSVTYIVRDTTNDVRVSNAMVTIKDTLESTVSAGPTSTGINGYVTVNLDDGTYVALVTANNVTFSTDTFVVSGATTDSIMGYGQMIATAPSSAYCSVYGTLTGAGYEDGGSENVASRWYVRFTLEEAKSNLSDTSATKVVVIKTVDASTDANGYFNVFLLKTENLLYKSGSAYKQPIWRMVASPVDVKNDPRIDITFSIPSDSTTLNIGGIISAE